MKIRTLIITGFLTVALFPLIFIGYLAVDIQSLTQFSLILNSETQQIFSTKEAIDDFLETAESDILFLSDLHSLNELINTDDPDDAATYKTDVQTDLFSFSREKKIYYQIRYINENGREVIRIDSVDEKVIIVPENKLQNKKERYYFKDAMSALKGVVYASPLDLNIENGIIENRGTEQDPIYVPMIRYATPVFDSNGQSKGIIVTNLYVGEFLENIQRFGKEGRVTFLINKEGYYLSHPDKNKEWGFMFKNSNTIQNDYDRNLLNQTVFHLEEDIKESRLFSKVSTTDVDVGEHAKHFVIHTHVWPSGSKSLSSTGANEAYGKSVEMIQGREYYWTLITVADNSYIFAPIENFKQRAYWIGFFTFLFVILASLIVTDRISKPLIYLRDAVVKMGGMKIRKKIKVKTKNEIGELTKAFNDMTARLFASQEQVEKYAVDLEKQVKKRTGELEMEKRETEKKAGKMEEMKIATLNILEDAKEAEEEMRRAKMGIELSDEAVFITDKNAVIQYVNPAFEKIYGYKALEVIGKNPRILKYEGMPRNHIKALWNALLNKKSLTFTMFNKTKSGDMVNIKQSANPILDENNETIGYMAIQTDITEHAEAEKMLAESEVKFRALFESAGDTIFTVKMDARRGPYIVDVNSRAIEMFGRTHEEMLKESPLSLSPPNQPNGKSSRELIMRYTKAVLAGKKQVFEWIFLHADGSEFPAEVTLNRVKIGDEYFIQAMIQDITERKEIDQAKNEFVSLTSHQLRTPLTGVKWLIQAVLKKGGLSKWQIEFLEDALKSNDRMILLVNDLLNISRLEAGVIGVSPRKTDLSEFIDELVKDAKISARDRGQATQIKVIKPSKKIIINLDQQLIGQVITNLLSNAVKYGKSKKPVLVSITRKKDQAEISVKDNGIGIAKKDQNKLFTKFFRTEKATRVSTTGSGLGLYIVKKILDACSGSIKCHSDLGKGSTFSVSLPIKGPKIKGGKKSLISHKIS